LRGAKTPGSKRDIPKTQEALDVSRRRSEKSENNFIFSLRRAKTKNKQVGRIGSLKKAHVGVIKKHFAEAPFVPYSLRQLFATRCVQAGVGVVELAGLLGHAGLDLAPSYVRMLKEQKVTAIAKLEE
jgi:integrase